MAADPFCTVVKSSFYIIGRQASELPVFPAKPHEKNNT